MAKICLYLDCKAIFAQFFYILSAFTCVYVKSRVIKAKVFQIFKKQEELQTLAVSTLKLMGTGYKCIAPKKFNRKELFLRVGFAASELKYSLLRRTLKMRAKKQKIVLFWF